MGWLSAIPALLRFLPFLDFIKNWLEDRQERLKAKEMAEAAVNQTEARVAHDMAEILAERRSDSAGSDRLRDGSF